MNSKTHQNHSSTTLSQVLGESASSPARQAEPAPASILLVDDSPDKLFAVKTVLSDLNQTIVTAHSGREALRLLLKQNFAVILLDVNMPGMDGFETAVLIRQRRDSEYTPIIFLSGISQEDTHVSRGYSLGAVDYLFAPVNPDVLRAKVSAFIELSKKNEEIKASEERFRSVTETALAAMITMESDGTIIYGNRSALRIFGYSSDEMLGRSIALLVPKEFTVTRMSTLLGKTLVLRGRKKNGKQFPVEVSLATWRSHDQTYFTAIINDITDRQAAEKQIRQYTYELEQAQGVLIETMQRLKDEIKERKAAEQKILEISGREQRRMGQELHDGLGQTLTGIGFMAKLLAKKLAEKNSQDAPAAEKISALFTDVISKTRDLARGFYPVELESNGLIAALQELASREENIFAVHCLFSAQEGIGVSDLDRATQVYRIAQEAIENAIKHGQAKNIEVNLQLADGRFTLTIRDDGIGFPKLLPKKRGMGLQIMKYRAGMIEGTFDIRRMGQRGTLVTCSFPNKNV